MSEHQRNVLAQMGIDIWIPQQTAVHACSTKTVWRDQVPTVAVKEQPSVVKKTPQPIVENIVKPVIEKKIEQPQKIVQSDSFVLQTYNINDQVCILVNIINLTSEEKEFLENFQQSMQTSVAEIKWPMPLQNFQDQDYMDCYVEGFLAVHAKELQYFSFGELEFLNCSCIVLPTVKEILSDSLLKKEIWKNLRGFLK